MIPTTLSACFLSSNLGIFVPSFTSAGNLSVVFGLDPLLLHLSARHEWGRVVDVCAAHLDLAEADLVGRAIVSGRLGQSHVGGKRRSLTGGRVQFVLALALFSNNEVGLFKEFNATWGQLELSAGAVAIAVLVVRLRGAGPAARSDLVVSCADIVRHEGRQR